MREMYSIYQVIKCYIYRKTHKIDLILLDVHLTEASPCLVMSCLTLLVCNAKTIKNVMNKLLEICNMKQ